MKYYYMEISQISDFSQNAMDGYNCHQVIKQAYNAFSYNDKGSRQPDD